MLVKVLLFLYNIFMVIEMKESFFDYFKEEGKLADEDKKHILEIIEIYKKKNHAYYKTLEKIYGENYDQLNTLVTLTTQEYGQLNNFRYCIKKEIASRYEIKEVNEIRLETDEENKDTLNFDLTMRCLYKKFPALKEEKTLNLVILTSFIDEGKSVEYISQLTKIPMKKIDNILFSHLYLFSYKMPELIDDILERGNYTISQVTSFKFIATQEPFLNETEKELLYNKIVIMHQLEVKKLLKLEEKNKTKILK